MQTHNKSNRIRNHAALFIITKRALQDGIAPDVEICDPHDNYQGDDNDDGSGPTPDGPQREKLPCFVLLVLDLQEGALADEVLVSLEDSLFRIPLLTVLLVFSVQALNVVVAPIILLKADLSTDKKPIPCCAHQMILLAQDIISTV